MTVTFEFGLQVCASDPLEVVVISMATNTYLHAIDGHAERERQFLDMAIHELRTPLAVISGAAEVAIAPRHPPVSPSCGSFP